MSSRQAIGGHACGMVALIFVPTFILPTVWAVFTTHGK